MGLKRCGRKKALNAKKTWQGNRLHESAVADGSKIENRMLGLLGVICCWSATLQHLNLTCPFEFTCFDV